MTTVAQVQKHLVDTAKQIIKRNEGKNWGLNARPHFIPVTKKAFTKVLAGKLKGISVSGFLEKVELALIAELGTNTRRFLHVGRFGFECPGMFRTKKKLSLEDINKVTPTLVFENGELIGVLASSFRSAQEKVVRVLNAQLGEYSISSTKFNLGHTEISSRFGGDLADTPVGLALNSSISSLEEPLFRLGTENKSRSKVGNAINNSQANADLAKEIAEELRSIRREFNIHSEYGSYIEKSFSKEFSDALLKINANVVLVQDGDENQTWGREVEKRISTYLFNTLRTLNFSNNMEEEVVARITATLLKKKVSKTSKRVSSKTQLVAEKLVTTQHGSLTVTSKAGSLVNPATNRKLGPSLASLQLIINQHLPHVISANMGDQPEPGGQRRILNYRTGRFANSAEVERLTMSKDGMVTAFYSYMKNPYATFSEGGRQYKSSRDPKKLISESIHEIARQYVGNRMRAVVV